MRFGVIESMFAQPRFPPQARLGRDYFPETRKVAAIHRELVAAAEVEIDRSRAPDEVKRAVLALLKAGHVLNKTVPKTKDWFNVAALNLKEGDVQDGMDAAWELAANLKVMRESRRLPHFVRNALGFIFRDRVKRDLYNVTADALLADLSRAINVKRGAVEGARRLMLVIDDYEVLAPVLQEFLVGALVQRLATAHFPTLLVILCRDDLAATHPGWAHHAHRHFRDQVRLAAFSREVATAMLRNAGIPEERCPRLFELTEGFPFLLSLVIEEAGTEGADSALFLRKFFDRTTRWMTDQQRGWVKKVCYLDAVNEDSLPLLFPREEVARVQDWFEKEPSIRDPRAATFRVRPLIRDKVLQYQAIRAPNAHRETLQCVAEYGKKEAAAVGQ
jgi:hypothetical protein